MFGNKLIFASALSLLTIGAAMAQTPIAPAPLAPATGNPAKGLSLDEAARRLIDLCTDHALGTPLIPNAQYRLQIMGFELRERNGYIPGPHGPIYFVDAPTKAGVMSIEAEPNGQCSIMGGNVPRAAFDAAFRGAFGSSTSYINAAPRVGWRWQSVLASVSELSGPGMVRIRPFFK